jgi:hypothetical protein
MDNRSISAEKPLPGQSSSVDAQQHTYSTLDLSDEQNMTDNVDNVKEPDTI